MFGCFSCRGRAIVPTTLPQDGTFPHSPERPVNAGDRLTPIRRIILQGADVPLQRYTGAC